MALWQPCNPQQKQSVSQRNATIPASKQRRSNSFVHLTALRTFPDYQPFIATQKYWFHNSFHECKIQS
ncbi:unnamed protein product [Calypogeia fissa]